MMYVKGFDEYKKTNINFYTNNKFTMLRLEKIFLSLSNRFIHDYIFVQCVVLSIVDLTSKLVDSPQEGSEVRQSVSLSTLATLVESFHSNVNCGF